MQTAPLAELDALVAEFGEALTPGRVTSIIVERAAPLLGAQRALLVLHEGALLHVPEGLEAAADGMMRDPSAPARAAMRDRLPVMLGADASRDRGWPAPDGCGWAFVPLVIRRRPIAALALALPASRMGILEEGLAALVVRQCALALDRALLHELELRHRSDMEAETARFRSLVQELDAVFWEADPRTFAFTFVSQRAEALFGYPSRRWLEPGFWADILHPEDRSWAVEFCASSTRAGEDHVFEYRVLDRDGETRWVRDVVYVVRDRSGRPDRLRGVMLDVTRDREAGATRVPVARRLPAGHDAPSRHAS